MNKDLIPSNLRHLMSLVEKWGIEDDGYRDSLVYNSSNDELSNLVESFSNEDAANLNVWLSEEEEMKKCSLEYLKYSAFFTAYEYAEVLVKSRINEANQ